MSEEKITIITNRVVDSSPMPENLGIPYTEGLFCDKCDEPVVLTDSTFPHLQKPHQIICTRCAKGLITAGEKVELMSADERMIDVMEENSELIQKFLEGEEDLPYLSAPDSL